MTRGALGGCLLFAVLFTIQAILRPAPAPVRGGGAGDAVGVLSGAVQPLRVAATWLLADAALQDRRVLDAVDHLRTLEALDTTSVAATLFRAHVVAHDVADREGPAGRAARVVEAVRMLEAASARSAEVAPLLAKGQLLVELRAWEPDLGARIEAALGTSPPEAAREALDAVLRREDAPGIRKLAAHAARLSALWRLRAGAPLAEARAFLDEALVHETRVGEARAAKDLAVGSAALVGAALDGDASAIDAAVRTFVRALELGAPETQAGDFEALGAGWLGRSLVGVAEERVARGDAAAALSLVAAVHTIRHLLAARFDRSQPVLRDYADARRVLALLDDVARVEPALKPRVAAIAALVKSW